MAHWRDRLGSHRRRLEVIIPAAVYRVMPRPVHNALTTLGHLLTAGIAVTAIGRRPQVWRLQLYYHRVGALKLHRWLAGDYGPAHQHAFDMWAIALWGSGDEEIWMPDGGRTLRRIRPFVLRVYRDDIHRVVRVRSLWTLAFAGPSKRQGGYLMPDAETGKMALTYDLDAVQRHAWHPEPLGND